MTSRLGLDELADLLDLTQQHSGDPDKERAAKAEGAAMEVLEILARLLGDDSHAHLSALIIASGETLGRASRVPAELDAGAKALRKGAYARALVAALRGQLDILRDQE